MQAKLDKYAAVLLEVGLGFTAGQRLYLTVDLDFALLTQEVIYLVRAVTEQAYKLGARNVITDWRDDILYRLRLQHATEASLDDVKPLFAEQLNRLAEENTAFLYIGGRDPNLLEGIAQPRIQRQRKATNQSLQDFNQRMMRNDVTWLVAAIPSIKWAKKVYPTLTDEAALERLWQAIFTLSRVEGGDPVEDWRVHSANLQQRADNLNRKQYAALHYTGPGTDLHVGLPRDHHWIGGGSISKSGIAFVPNIPTEEIFTMPDSRNVNGTVSATFPFSTFGTMVEGMQLTFVDGRVTDARATTNQESLLALLDQDEGARALGEVALVPHSSPISQSKTIYYNTLFDENAASHIAIGQAYPSSLVGGATLAEDELKARGANFSDVHADFMVGSDALNIDGITHDGAVESIMRNGEWAFTLG
jgi:aminopeptidase